MAAKKMSEKERIRKAADKVFEEHRGYPLACEGVRVTNYWIKCVTSGLVAGGFIKRRKAVKK